MKLNAKLTYFTDEGVSLGHIELPAHTTERDTPKYRGIEISMPDNELGTHRSIFIPFAQLKRIKQFLK